MESGAAKTSIKSQHSPHCDLITPVHHRKRFRLRLAGRTLALGERTLVMGVLNVTLDSFSDGGQFLDPEAAARHALEMEAEGADIIDIGGESTRPGSDPVAAGVEMARVLPVL